MIWYGTQKVTLLGMLARSLIWPLVMELFHENGIQPQPDPLEGIGNLTLLVVGYTTAVSVTAPMVRVFQKSRSLIWPGEQILLF